MGQQVRALSMPHHEQSAAVSALLNYFLGAGGQNAAHVQTARTRGADCVDMLGAVAAA